jgi:hypothetical protein
VEENHAHADAALPLVVACVAIWPKVLHIIWHMRWGDTQPCPITKLSRAASTTPVETL